MSLIRVGKVVLNRLIENGYEAYFVGGMVRDRLLGRDIYDIDITTSATPDVVIGLFEKTIQTGIKHGTVTVMIEGIPVEVTTFRVEEAYEDFRRPSEVRFTSSLIEDLKRRDFTMNAIAESIDGTLEDPFQGLKDLSNRQIKAVGEAKERFIEDPLRMLRGLRFMSKLGFELEDETSKAIGEVGALIEHISKERIKKEIEGMVSGEFSLKAFNLLIHTPLCDSITYFKELKRYSSSNLARLEEGVELFALIGLTVEEMEDYLKAWPFSNVEKRMIKAIRECYDKQLPPQYIQYKYKEDLALHYHRIQNVLKQSVEKFELRELPITDRKELAIEVADIIQWINHPKGPWLSQLLEALEFEVVMGTLENEVVSLRNYIQQLGEGYEIKK